MDITNEATVDAFSIGPSTIVGRTIALRVLLCGSLRRLRRHLVRLLRVALRRLRGDAKLPPLVAFLRPRHALGILALVSLAAFALRRFANERPLDGVGEPAQVLSRRDGQRHYLRGVVARRQDSRRGNDDQDKRGRALRGGAHPEQAAGATPPPSAGLAAGHHLRYAC